MSDKQPVRDLIYLDFGKVASLASQLDKGLLKEIHDSQSDTSEIEGGINIQVANFGKGTSDSTSQLVIRSIHHDLLTRVEKRLLHEGLAVDLNACFGNQGASVAEIHQMLKAKPYVRVEGTCRFHDYQRMKNYMDGFNKIFEFMEESAKDKIRKQLEHTINLELAKLDQITDRNQKKKREKELERRTKNLAKEIDSHVADQVSQKLPEWQVEGIKDIIDLLMPSRNNLLMRPFDELAEFIVMSNLKSEFLVDADLDHVLFAYGSQPQMPLTVFGLVTSVANDQSLSNWASHAAIQGNSISEVREFEQAFHAGFDATSQIEKFGLFAYYPRVTVYPLAVYNSIRK